MAARIDRPSGPVATSRLLAYIKTMRRDDVIAKLKETEPVLRAEIGYSTRNGLSPYIRADVERDALRIF
jgi:hypothetical protein